MFCSFFTLMLFDFQGKHTRAPRDDVVAEKKSLESGQHAYYAF